VSIALLELNAAYAIRSPPEDAVNTPTWLTVPYDAVAVGNSIAAELDAVLPDTVKLADCLAYAVPEVLTSVPLASSAGLLVNSARYQAVGLVTLVAVNT
tara:strand:+ start:379 stop:675 length:297 start_codon:yes stop_codon:yes gene_type:complete